LANASAIGSPHTLDKDQEHVNVPRAMERPFVSVVTPFYNTEPHIAQCIESVLSQSYTNFEYILVDNQSTDGSDQFAKKYAKEDGRIRLLRTPRFLSQMENMSFAVQSIHPDSSYCKTLFADDWLYPPCVEQMVGLAEAHPDVAIVGSYYLREARLAGSGLDVGRSVFSGREVCQRYFLDNLFPFGSQSTVMYRASLIRAQTPFFVDGHLHEDTEAAFRSLTNHNFGFVHQILSFMRLQEGSLSGSTVDFFPEALDRLILVKRFGRSFLDATDYETVLQNAVRTFYRGLGKQWAADLLGARKPGFWEYQIKGLQTIDERIHPALIARYLAGGIIESAVRPADFFRMIRQLLPFPRTPSKN
jgi:glycosyltransferase involved in cell wall biosynthesis